MKTNSTNIPTVLKDTEHYRSYHSYSKRLKRIGKSLLMLYQFCMSVIFIGPLLGVLYALLIITFGKESADRLVRRRFVS